MHRRYAIEAQICYSKFIFCEEGVDFRVSVALNPPLFCPGSLHLAGRGEQDGEWNVSQLILGMVCDFMVRTASYIRAAQSIMLCKHMHVYSGLSGRAGGRASVHASIARCSANGIDWNVLVNLYVTSSSGSSICHGIVANSLRKERIFTQQTRKC